LGEFVVASALPGSRGKERINCTSLCSPSPATFESEKMSATLVSLAVVNTVFY
jgi:hypothetical protein